MTRSRFDDTPAETSAARAELARFSPSARLYSPMPSMETALAFWLRQLSTTDWPRSIAPGSAVMVAVGAAAAAAGVGPRALGSTPLAFLWQPVTMAIATNVVAKARVLLIL